MPTLGGEILEFYLSLKIHSLRNIETLPSLRKKFLFCSFFTATKHVFLNKICKVNKQKPKLKKTLHRNKILPVLFIPVQCYVTLLKFLVSQITD